MRPGMSKIAFPALFLILLLAPVESAARPEIAARGARPCWKCHVNPTGGGMRNETGSHTTGKLSLKASKAALQKNHPTFIDFDPAVNDSIRLGFDGRIIWHDRVDDPAEARKRGLPEDAAPEEGGTFYLMQAALYLNARLLPILQFQYAYDAAQNTFEAYGMIDDLPAGLYFRAGRFLLPYGLRFEDHTIFTRASLGFHNIAYDTGVEVGIRPGPFFLIAAFTNGNAGAQEQDKDEDHYALTTQTGVRFWKLGLGGSYHTNTREGLVRHVFGPWLSFGLWRFVLLAEADLFNQQTTDGGDPEKFDHIIGSASVVQVEFKVISGLYLQTLYTHMDTDWEVDESYRDQVAGGILLYPFPHFKLTAQYRYNREPEEINNNRAVVQIHSFF